MRQSRFDSLGGSFFAVIVVDRLGADQPALWRTHQPFFAVGIKRALADWIICDDEKQQIFRGIVGKLMRLVRSKEKRIPTSDRRCAFLMTDEAAARDDVIEFPLRAVRVIGIRCLARRDPGNFDIKWMSRLQIGRERISSKRL